MASTATDDSGMGAIEGRLAEQSPAIQGIRAGLLGVTARIDRLFPAMLGIGAAQVGLLATLVVRVG